MTQEAMDYLNEALDVIQKHSVRRELIDWPMLRQEATTFAADAQTPAETYPAIEKALKLLGDHHSFFRTPAEQQLLAGGKIKRSGLYATFPEGIIGMIDPGSPAEHAHVHVGDRIETVNGQLFTSLTVEQFRNIGRIPLDLILKPFEGGPSRQVSLQVASYEAHWLPQGRRLANDIGYLNLPALLVGGDPAKAYANTLQQIIREIDQSATRGWVIDLRRNIGGSMWPMWAGLGSILGEGELVSFVAPGEILKAVYRNGQAVMEPGKLINEVEDPYELKCPAPPVAVLTGIFTASAGEFVALSFRGRPHTNSFGEPTLGVPTGNDGKLLSDRAMICLTAYIGADRSGQTYEGPLVPDHPVPIDWTELGTDDDPVLQAALQWLSTDAGCLDDPNTF